MEFLFKKASAAWRDAGLHPVRLSLSVSLAVIIRVSLSLSLWRDAGLHPLRACGDRGRMLAAAPYAVSVA